MQQALAGVCLLAGLVIKHLRSGGLVSAYALEFRRGVFQAYRFHVDFTTNESKISYYIYARLEPEWFGSHSKFYPRSGGKETCLSYF